MRELCLACIPTGKCWFINQVQRLEENMEQQVLPDPSFDRSKEYNETNIKTVVEEVREVAGKFGCPYSNKTLNNNEGQKR